MIRLLFIALSSLLSFLPFSLNSYAASCPIDSGITKIYFINGVLNSDIEAQANAKAIKSAYESELKVQYPDEHFEFNYSYNYSAKGDGVGAGVLDFVEFFEQKIAELGLKLSKWMAPQYFSAFISGSWELLLNDPDLKPKDVEALRELHQSAMEFYASHWPNQSESDSHVRKYVNDLTDGKRLILIAHSQGNLFAQRAMTLLEPRYGANIGMIGVASPASIEVGNSTHYTATDDRVIQLLRMFTSVLDANVENDPGLLNDPRDLDNHGFINSYFSAGLNSRSLIDEDFYSKVATLEKIPPPLFKISMSNDGKGMYDQLDYHSEQCGMNGYGETVCDYYDIGMLPIEVYDCNAFLSEFDPEPGHSVTGVMVPSPNSMGWSEGYDHNLYTSDHELVRPLAPMSIEVTDYTGPFYRYLDGSEYYKVQKYIDYNFVLLKFYVNNGELSTTAKYFETIEVKPDGDGTISNSIDTDTSIFPESCFNVKGVSSWCTGSDGRLEGLL